MKPLYLVECSYGRLGNAFRETDRDTNSLAGILELIRSGEIVPVKILKIDEEMNRVENITAEVMANVTSSEVYRTPLSGEELAAVQADRRRAIEMAE